MGKKSPGPKIAKKCGKLLDTTKNLSPFDQYAIRAKHHLSNYPSASIVTNITNSRTKGNEKRLNTLKVEWENRNKINSIVDRRYGEHDPTMPNEDKMLYRLQRSRIRQAKQKRNNIYNLESDQEDMVLTHKGQQLEDINYGVPVGLEHKEDSQYSMDDDGSDNSQYSESKSLKCSILEVDGDEMMRNDGHFVLGDEIPGSNGDSRNPKPKAVAMKEVMFKNKYHRHQHQLELQKQMELVHELDAEFDALKEQLNEKKCKSGEKQNASLDHDDTGSRKHHLNQDSDDDYYALFNKMNTSNIPRAKPSDPLIKEEDFIKAQAEKLVQLEKDRIARMNAAVDETDDQDQFILDNKTTTIPVQENALSNSSCRKPNADDLDEEFTNRWVTNSEIDEQEYDMNSCQFEQCHEDSSDESEGITRSGFNLKLVSSSHQPLAQREMNLNDSISHLQSPSTNPTTLSGSDELPYIFAMPDSYLQFSKLLKGHSAARQAIILGRLQACHHLSLHPDNRKKLETLLGYILRRIVSLGRMIDQIGCDPNHTSSNQSEKSLPLSIPISMVNDNFQSHTDQLWILVDPLRRIALQMSPYAVLMCKNVISKMEDMVTSSLSNAIDSTSGNHSGEFLPLVPDASMLFFVQIMSLIWPCSDRIHAILTPVNIFIGHLLSSLRLLKTCHVFKALFLINIFYEFLEPAKRWASEPFNVLLCIIENFILANSHLWKDKRDEVSFTVPTISNPLPSYQTAIYIAPNCLKLRELPSRKSSSHSQHRLRDGLIWESDLLWQDNQITLANIFDVATFSTPERDTTVSSPLPKKQEPNQDSGDGDYPSLETIKHPRESKVHEHNAKVFKTLLATFRILRSYLNLYSTEEYSIEILNKTLYLLNLILDDANKPFLPKRLVQEKQMLAKMAERCVSKLSSTRLPLQLFKKKMNILPMLTPDFEERYFGKRPTDNKILEATKKLGKKHKTAMKNAAKELRKDSYFLGQTRLAERLERDAHRDAKYNETMKFLLAQQAEFQCSKKKK